MSQPGPSGPRAAPVPAQPPPPPPDREEKRALQSWWRGFKKSDKKGPEHPALPQGIFGVPLQQSIRYANVAISLLNDEGQSYIYGYVPIVVAKCGVYLKEKATDVEGIFRLAGSEKRIKELKVAFDSPERYGKGLDWTGYTVHDAANILRRYFNQLPEPIIPLDFYDRFRDPIRNHQAQAVGPLDAQRPSIGEFDHDGTIRTFQNLITELPPLNRQLLLYILDLLAVFASKADLNKMNTQNLSAIFQPGILRHPQHDMAPPEYRLSQDVLIFLIDNQDSFLIGMQGTAADTETVREVQSGVPTPSKQPTTPTTPNRAKTVIGRTGSNASAGAESVRRWGSIRRNVSVTSKNSKRSEAGPTPVTPAMGSPSPSTSSGVHRSNTAPSRRGKGSAQASPRVSGQKDSDPVTPTAATLAVAEAMKPKQDSLQNTPVAMSAPQFPPKQSDVRSMSSVPGVASDSSSAVRSDIQTPKQETTPLLAPAGGSGEKGGDRAASGTPSATGKGFLDIFKQSPGSEGEGRKPNKLRKKHYPGSALSSAQSSSQSLDEQEPQRSPIVSGFPAAFHDPPTNEKPSSADQSAYATAQTTPTASLQPPQSPPQRTTTDATLKPTLSPSNSFHSTTDATDATDVTDASDADMGGDELPSQLPTSPDKERKRHRWRFSRTQNKFDQTNPGPPPTNPFGTKENTTSRSTVGSSNFSNSQPRRSFQEPTPLTPSATDPSVASGSPQQAPASTNITPSSTDPAVFSDSEREKRGPMGWIRGKLQERREKEEAKRSSTPERGGGGLHGGHGHGRRGGSRVDVSSQSQEGLAVRGKSFEGARGRPVSGVVPVAVGGGEGGSGAGTNTALGAAMVEQGDVAPRDVNAPAVQAQQPTQPLQAPGLEQPPMQAPLTQAAQTQVPQGLAIEQPSAASAPAPGVTTNEAEAERPSTATQMDGTTLVQQTEPMMKGQAASQGGFAATESTTTAAPMLSRPESQLQPQVQPETQQPETHRT